MSWVTFTSFPRKMKLSPSISYERYMEIREKGEVYVFITDKRDTRFDNCFKNQFIYQLEIHGISDDTYEQRQKIVQKYMDEEKIVGYLDRESMDNELRKYWEIERAKYRKVMHDFYDESIKVGEFVEVYTAWDNHMGDVFDLPTIEEVITLQEYLSMSTKKMSLEERYRTVICKTK